MGYARPLFRREDTNSAGAIFTGALCPFDHEHALDIINNWRSSHAFPLNAFHVTLRGRAKRIDTNALTAQRLKRLPSISAKLQRFPDMKLTQMQDLGGCRAVVKGIAEVEKLVAAYNKAMAKNPGSRHEFLNLKDYIARPKDDGYRSYHMIYRYRSGAKKHQAYNGLKIEIQIRTKLQHAWATAVEIISIFTGQALKSNIGDEGWKRFFKLMSSDIAFREGQPLVPDTPEDHQRLIAELRDWVQKLDVMNILAGLGAGINVGQRLQQEHFKAKFHTYLMILDSKKRAVNVTGYYFKELQKAQQDYLKAEKDNADSPWIQSVLVSVDSLVALRRAYPNFYLDAAAFAAAVNQAVWIPQETKKSARENN